MKEVKDIITEEDKVCLADAYLNDSILYSDSSYIDLDTGHG